MGPHLDVAPINHTRPLLPPPAADIPPSRHPQPPPTIPAPPPPPSTSPTPGSGNNGAQGHPAIPQAKGPVFGPSLLPCRGEIPPRLHGLHPPPQFQVGSPSVASSFSSSFGYGFCSCMFELRPSILVVAVNGAACGNCVDLGTVSVGGRFFFLISSFFFY